MPATTTQRIPAAPRQIAEAGYIFGYPLVLLDVTRQVATNVPKTSENAAPINQFGHKRSFPDDTFTTIVSPNADTLYSFAFLDLTKEPMVLSVPAMGSRYYLMQLLDAWTNVFAAPGTRTTGQEKGDFAIVGPGWSGSLPTGVKKIKAPTNIVWLIGRTQTNGKADFPAVNAIQDEYKLAPLSGFTQGYKPPSDVATDPRVDMRTPPVEQVARMTSTVFFDRLARLMKANPPAEGDAGMISDLSRMGLAAGRGFFEDELEPQQVKDVDEGVAAAKTRILDSAKHVEGRMDNGWASATVIGSYGTDYNQRAAVAFVGLGANSREDAIYPMAHIDGNGAPLHGANRYVVHFGKDGTPPVNAFWSITMYNDQHFMVANPIKRYAIGDRDALTRNPDGSLDLYLQHDSPGGDKESNWLPAPAGGFNLILRMYWPKPEALDNTWKPPAVQIVK